MSDNYDGPAMAQQILRLQAERDVLREKLQEWWKAFEGHLYIKTEKYSELIAERDALRDALEKIVNAKYYLHPEDLKEIARAALDAARSKT